MSVGKIEKRRWKIPFKCLDNGNHYLSHCGNANNIFFNSAINIAMDALAR